MNLYVLSICVPNQGWLPDKVFCELEQSEMNKEIAAAQEKGHSVTTLFVPSSSAIALQKYFTSK